MNIKRYEAFLAVIDLQTMSAAADALYTTQPNISHMIQELEKQYRASLFYRENRALTLTSQGRILETHARRLLHEYRQLQEAMSHSQPTVRIGSTVTVGQFLLDDCIDHLKSKFPNLIFEIIIHNTEEIEQLLLERKLDVAIIEGTVHSKTLEQTTLVHDELVAVIGSVYPNDYHVTSIFVLQFIPWIRREKGSQERNQFEIEMARRDINPPVVYRSTNLDTILQAVSKGYGFAIVSLIAATMTPKHDQLRILPIHDFKCERDIRLVTHPQYDSELTKEIINFYEK